MTDQSIPFPNLPKTQQEFLDKLKIQGKSVNTVKNYKTDLDCFNYFWKDQKGSLDLTGFGIPQVQDYGAFLDQKYNSDNSKRRRVQALRIFFDFLVEKGHFNENPVRSLLTSPKVVDIPRPVPYIDLKTLWSYMVRELKSSSDMDHALAYRNAMLFLLIYGSGLKVSHLS
ncbi:MAG: site-specific integrase, partial [Bacteriovoracaceae bacterium]